MKNLFLITALLCSSAPLFSQNYMANPSFEVVTALPPASIFGGQVDSWFSYGDEPVATNAHFCPPINITAQDQALFADGVLVDRAIVNVLARPILPYQKLDISFWALITACSWKPAYIVEFYVSNSAINTANNFPLFPNPSQFLKVGQKYIFNPNDTWKPYTTTLQVNPYPFSPVPCNYKYLVVVLRNSPFLTGGPEASVPSDEVMFDNFNLTECQSTIASSILYNIDNEGICSKVLFTAQCQNISGLHYVWDFGDGTCETTTSMTVEHTYLSLGSYNVTLQIVDANGCISRASETVLVDCPRCEGIAADFSSSCIDCLPSYLIDPKTGIKTLVGYTCQFNFTDLSVPSTGSTIQTWTWRSGASVLSNQQNPTVYIASYNSNGAPFNTEVCLQITDANGCTDNFCKNFTLPCREKSETLQNADIPESFTVTPNPGTGEFVVHVPVEFWEKNSTLHITDMQGRLISRHKISAGTDQLDVHLNEVDNGIYLFSFQSDDVRQFKKVVVQK